MAADGRTTGEKAAEGPVEPERVTTSTRDPAALAAQLEGWLGGVLPGGSRPVIGGVSIPQSNGMSSETLLFTAGWQDANRPVERQLVARIEPPASAHPVFTTYDLGMQFEVMRLVRDHTAVPVPEPLWYEADPAVLGGPFFVMERVEGQVPPDVMPYTFGDNWLFDSPAADRHTIQESAVRAMAGIHDLTPAAYDLSFLEHGVAGTSALERSLRHWRDYHEWVVKDRPSPLLAECFAWLEQHFPTETLPDALSWGDGRIGNMIFRDNEVVAVLDWEMVGIAPPEVDLGWMCYLHLFFQDLATDLGAPGLPEMFRPSDVRASYFKESGRNPGDLTWFLAYAAIRHGVIMRRVTERSILFGEAEAPEHVDDLIMHRATLERMLEGTYWETLSL
jgi:aminoglycoside phosphotransferase (APT) family kinase protein